MKVIGIIGSRRRNTTDDFQKVREALGKVYNAGDEIVSGGCGSGADEFAEFISRKEQVPIKIYYAPWRARGKSAGFWRNQFIARDADVLIACVAGNRHGGTEDTIRKFQKLHPEGQVILV